MRLKQRRQLPRLLEVSGLTYCVALLLHDTDKWKQNFLVIKVLYLAATHHQSFPLSNCQSTPNNNTVNDLLLELNIYLHMLIEIGVKVELVLFHFCHFVSQL
jgi:hypothetical protein